MANDNITSCNGIEDITMAWSCEPPDVSTLVITNRSSTHAMMTPGNSTPMATLSTAAKVTTVGGHTPHVSYVAIGSICFGVVDILGNLLASVVFVTHKPLRSKLSNYFLINQSVIDLLIGVLVLVVYTSNLDNMDASGTIQHLLCVLWRSRIFVVGLLLSSVLCIVAITVERYLEVVHPIAHRVKVTRKKVMYIICAI